MSREMDATTKRARTRIIRELDPRWHKCSACDRYLGRKKINRIMRLNGEMTKLCSFCLGEGSSNHIKLNGLAYISHRNFREIQQGWQDENR